MAGHEETRGEDMDNLLCAGLSEDSRVSGLDSLPPQPDHCDLLLDAMDAQLEQLQVWSHSSSKGAGVGHTTQTHDTPVFRLGLTHAPIMKSTSEDAVGCLEASVSHRGTRNTLDRSVSCNKEDKCRREQVIWRLERLLGDIWQEGMVAETCPPAESICTEDFVWRFREEMLELSPADSMEEQSMEERIDRAEISDCDTDLTDQSVKRTGSPTADTVTDLCSQSNTSSQQNQQRKYKFGTCGAHVSPFTKEAAERSKTLQKLADYDKVNYRANPQNHENAIHSLSCFPEPRCLSGASVRCLTSPSIDSDSDTPTKEERDPQSASVRSPSTGQNGVLSVHKNPMNRRKTCRVALCPRLVRSLMDNGDTSEESDPDKMKKQLLHLQKKHEKEEKKLKLKWTQVKKAELCLSELQQNKKHALQHLEQLSANTAQMEQEERTLESALRDFRAAKQSVSFQLQQLQRQRESCLLQVQEHLATLPRHKQTQQDESCTSMIHKQSEAIVSALQWEEMEQQLDSIKAELLTEQQRAREEVRLLQEKLEETCEELHGITEVDCAALENQIDRNDQTEALEVQVRELQHELGECKLRVGMLDSALSQKQLQLSRLQEQCGSLQTERDELKRKLQHLKTQHWKELKEAQKQTSLMLANKEAEEEKVRKTSSGMEQENNKPLEELKTQSEEAELRLQQDVELAVRQRGRLQTLLGEQTSSFKRCKTEMEQQLRLWARQLTAECQQLHLLVEQNGAQRGAEETHQSFTLAEALPRLRVKREQLKIFIRHLQQKLETQKHTIEQLTREKEQELSVQGQQLSADKDQALDSLRTRLLQEHMEELSTLKRAHESEAGGAASLHRQLQDKDLELRQLQRSMAQWKKQTAARLAGMFEDQLTAELERCKAKLIRSRKASKTEEVSEREVTLSAKETQKAVDSAAALTPSDVASLKLLHHLQSKVKQLRGESQASVSSQL